MQEQPCVGPMTLNKHHSTSDCTTQHLLSNTKQQPEWQTNVNKLPQPAISIPIVSIIKTLLGVSECCTSVTGAATLTWEPCSAVTQHPQLLMQASSRLSCFIYNNSWHARRPVSPPIKPLPWSSPTAILNNFTHYFYDLLLYSLSYRRLKYGDLIRSSCLSFFSIYSIRWYARWCCVSRLMVWASIYRNALSTSQNIDF